MAGFDGEQFGKELTSIVREFVTRKTSPLETRIGNLEREVTDLHEMLRANAGLLRELAQLRVAPKE